MRYTLLLTRRSILVLQWVCHTGGEVLKGILAHSAAITITAYVITTLYLCYKVFVNVPI